MPTLLRIAAIAVLAGTAYSQQTNFDVPSADVSGRRHIGNRKQLANHGGATFARDHAVYKGNQAIQQAGRNGVLDDEVTVGFEKRALIAGEPMCEAICFHICSNITAITRRNNQGYGPQLACECRDLSQAGL